MNTTRAFAALVAVTFLAAEGLHAQRRGTDGSGSGGRSTPSGGGSSSGGSRSGGSSGGSRSGGSSGGSGSSGTSGGSSRRGEGSGSGTKSGGSTRDNRAGDSGSSGTTASATGGSTARPRSGKIGAVRRDANTAARDHGATVFVDRGVYLGGTCFDCDYWGWYGRRWGWYHGGYWYPERRRQHWDDGDDNGDDNGQGYDDYPYAGADSADAGFVQPHVQRHHTFGAVTGQYFSDAGSGTRAGRFGIEGARGILRGEIEYAGYVEPTATTIDRLHTFRLAVGIQPRLGNQGYFVAAIGVRGLVLNNGGQSAGGPEGELGVQLLPRKPFGLNITGRAALMTWEATTTHFGLEELNTTGSIFVNRMELQAGWHWMKVGSAPAFGGPVVGMRVWF